MKMPVPENESQLVNKLVEKDPMAIREFVNRYQGPIFRICLGFVHNRQDAEELTQDVLVEIIKNIKSFKRQSKFKTWIYRVCYFRSLNKLKKDKWKKWMNSLDDLFGWNEPKEPLGDPSMILEQDELQTTLHHAIDKLPERQRVAFILSKYDQLSYQDIAEAMNISVSSVESLLFRAKQNLKSSLIKIAKE